MNEDMDKMYTKVKKTLREACNTKKPVCIFYKKIKNVAEHIYEDITGFGWNGFEYTFHINTIYGRCPRNFKLEKIVDIKLLEEDV